MFVAALTHVETRRNPDLGPTATTSSATSESLLGNPTAKLRRNPDFGPTTIHI